MRYARAAFLGLAAIQVLTLVTGLPLLPWAATATMAALLLWALAVDASRPLVAALTALTAAALVAEQPGDGWGLADDGWAALGAALLVGAATTAAGYGLTRTPARDGPRRRWVAAGAAWAAGGLVLVLSLLAVADPGSVRELRHGPLALAMAVPAAAALGLAGAAALAWAAGRAWAAAAALPLVVLAAVAAGALADTDWTDAVPAGALLVLLTGLVVLVREETTEA